MSGPFSFAGLEKLKIQENVPLAPLTTLKIGGNARYFFEARYEFELVDALAMANQRKWDVCVLGGGSNVLFADSGFDGLVIHIAISRSENRISETIPAVSDTRLITAGAGEEWDDFVSFCVQNNLAGLECLSGIPGTVGGTPVQNVGAYGQEVSESIKTVRCIDRETLRPLRLTNEDCHFSYRSSIFNSTQRDRYIVYDVTFSLRRNGPPKIVYKDLIEHFDGREPTLTETREAVLAIRRAKSMVIEAGDPNARSAGSFFKNPIVERAKLDEIGREFDRVPSFEFGDKVKIPAAWLIEKAGFQKGFTLGNAGISRKHTLALINRGGASAADLLALKTMVQEAVEKKFDIHLQPEPVFVGFDG